MLAGAYGEGEVSAEEDGHSVEAASEGDISDQAHIEPSMACLFPSFCLTIGVVAFWILSRYAHALPYTGVMFLIGTILGIGAEVFNNENHVNNSISQWVSIDSEVLLLVFLPGLIFKDAMGLNVHLFFLALGQCLIFAFPMVLAGTGLTAMIAHHIFPYGWSLNLSMAFGSILSATDPVAVAALLEQVGAPPRLKVQIAGESLLNDGAAIVFFGIFLERYLHEIGEDDLGEDIGWGLGIKIFLQKSLGAVAIGLMFACGLLLLLYVLNRRFNREENVVEVSATMAIAYIGYYTAEVVWATSGVIATVTLGVCIKFFGRAMINDAKLLDDFWTLVEHLLNTVLFALGGTVWGAVIAKGERDQVFVASDWGYLILLYALLHVIRLCLFIVAYPITVRIGLKTNPSETLFQVYGGLRGALGIALAIFLDNDVREATGDDSKWARETQKVFGMIGGISFMTLSINGITAGPLLRKLGLADSTETRQKLVKAYHTRFVSNAIDDFVKLLTQPRFKNTSFALVKHHVPYLADMTRAQLMEAVEKHKDTTRPEDYDPPYLKRVLPYLIVEEDPQPEQYIPPGDGATEDDETKDEFDPELHAKKIKRVLRTKNRMRRRTLSTMRVMMEEGKDPLSLKELRGLFISILRAAYSYQIRTGELQDREFLAIALEASLDFAENAVAKGEPIKDWEYVHLVDRSLRAVGKGFKTKMKIISCIETLFGKQAHKDVEYTLQRLKIDRSLAFMAAHRYAQQYMQREFENSDCELSELGKLVFAESQVQYRKAEAVLQKFDPEEVAIVVSHKLCLTLLNSGVAYIAKLENNGLLKEQEAEHMVHGIKHHIDHVLSCNEKDHSGEVTLEQEEEELRKQSRRANGHA